MQVSLAYDSLGATISWGQWALAGIVPGLILLLTVRPFRPRATVKSLSPCTVPP